MSTWNESNNTIFPNGVGQMTLYAAGGSAGDHTVSGVETDDRLLSVFAIEILTTSVGTVQNLTSEFSIDSADTINNDSGTDTTGDLLAVTICRGTPNS